MKKFLENPQIITYPHPILTSKTKEVDIASPLLPQVINKMFELMYAHKGIGLAAPQVGLSLALFVVNSNPDDKEKEIVFLNSKIIKVSKRTTIFEEGCLSLPNIRVEVERPKTIVIEYQTLGGETKKCGYDGLISRIIQHESDHINGVLITDKIRTNADSKQ